MIDLAILRAQVELGATPGRIVELVEQMLAEQSVLDFVVKQGLEKSRADRKRDVDRRRLKRWRVKKREERLTETRFTTPPETLCNAQSTKSKTCDEDWFGNLADRFRVSPSVSPRFTGNNSEESITSPLPCQATLFPLVEFKEEERKRTKKKEEVNDLSVSKKEEVFKCARAREDTPQPRSRGSRPRTALADDWKLPEVWFAWAERQGMSPQQVMLESFRFADSARAHNRIYADWNAAWRNWVRSPYRRTGPPAEPFDVRRHIV